MKRRFSRWRLDGSKGVLDAHGRDDTARTRRIANKVSDEVQEYKAMMEEYFSETYTGLVIGRVVSIESGDRKRLEMKLQRKELRVRQDFLREHQVGTCFV